ncbi:lysylphosphatidylglycerol synthase transmembrane domain-containing protein [Rhizobium sp. YIM 134829]|uniref:lysylphosphatidylglycerol synthase transmembrane domain-containing protein n=1 Tax=Rhizobium sp. YIM 134829 TaxID=3390453 RepID=UPI00397B1146
MEAERARHPGIRFLARHWVALASLLVVAAYAFLVERVWGWSTLLQQWQAIGGLRVASALAILLGTQILRTYRIYDYFPETRGQFAGLFRVVQLHNLVNILFPFRSGEASFPVLMRTQFAVPIARSSAALLWMRALDLHALLSVAGLALLLDAGQAVFRRDLLFLLWLAFCLLPAMAPLVMRRLGPLTARIRQAKLRRLAEEAYAGLPETTGAFLRTIAFTLVNWGAKLVALGWILMLLGLSSWAPAIGGAVGGELSSVLPVHAPGGVGTYPAGISAGAIAFGQDPSAGSLSLLGRAAVNAHMLIFVSALVSTAISLVLAAWRRR